MAVQKLKRERNVSYLDRFVATQDTWIEQILPFPKWLPARSDCSIHFIEITGLIPIDPGLVINNFDWILRIDKIGLLLQLFYINHLFWNGGISGAERHGKYYEPQIIGQEVPGDMLPAHTAQ